MRRAAKLKVFRTPIGFHDAYVAAPSQKAALEAWGTDANLFARGAAEVVTDPALTAEPLASPGVVIKRLRASAAEQIAALPPKPQPQRKPDVDAPSAPQPATRKRAPAPPKPKPRPSRAALDAAEAALEKAEQLHADARRGLAEREAELARERRALESEQEAERARLTRDLDRERRKFDEAIARWRG